MRDTSGQVYGHIRRRHKRDSFRLHALAESQRICNKHCEQDMQQLLNDAVDDSLIFQIYAKIKADLERNITNKYMPTALYKRAIFFKNINRARKQNGLAQLPSPVVAYRPKRDKNTADFIQFQYLSTAKSIEKRCINIWQSKTRFSVTDTITWILYSLIMYGGVNDEKIIQELFDYLRQNRLPFSFSKEQVFIPVEISSKKYANKVIQNDESGDMLLTYSRWIFIDDVTRLWLVYLEQIKKNTPQYKFPSYSKCIRRLSEFVGESFNTKNLNRSQFLKKIPIFWQTLPNSNLDQQSVQLLTNQQSHTSLDTNQWIQYHTPLKPQLRSQSKQLSLSDFESLQIQSQSHQLSKSESPTEVRYKSDLVKDIHSILHGPSSHIKPRLETLKQDTTELNHLIIIEWIIDLSVRHQTSTLKRYLTELGNAFIAETRNQSLSEYQAHDYANVYDRIVSTKNVLKKEYTQTVIHSLHKTLRTKFGITDLNIKREQDPQIVKSVLINPTTYLNLQYAIDSQLSTSNIEPYYIEMLSIITAILYRTGMRISEIIGLRLIDIEHDLSLTHFNLIIRANVQRSLKSNDATRRICLSILLKPDELERFKSFYLVKRQHKTNRYLFTLQGQIHPIVRYSVEQPLKKLLGKELSHISLHSFRHNALSNLAVILKCPYKITSRFTDYSQQETKIIKQHFLGEKRQVSASYWDALMEFAGHADLNTTFSSYIHTSDVICASQLAEAQITLPVGLVIKLTDKKRRSFNQHNPNALKDDVVRLDLIRKLINPLIEIDNLSATSSFVSSHEDTIQAEILSTKNDQENTVQNVQLFSKYNPEQVISLLTMMEEGKSFDDFYRFGFNYDDAIKIYDRAIELSKFDKLIYGQKQAKSAHPLISPTVPRREKEKAWAISVFRNIEQLYQIPDGQSQLSTMLSIFMTKVNKSHADLRFKFKEKERFYEFLDIILQITSDKLSKYWYVNVSVTRRVKMVNRRRGEKKHDFLVNEQSQSKIVKEFIKDYPALANNLTTKEYYSGYSLKLVLPVTLYSEENLVKPKVILKGSTAFRYVCHLLLILCETSFV